MSDLIPFQRPSASVERRVRRELGELTVSTGLAQARIQSAAEIEAARVSAVATVGSRAQEELALLIRQERALVESVPAAEASLLHLRDLTQIALGSVVMNAARRLGQ